MAASAESLLGHIHRLLSSANAAIASDAVLLERFVSQGDESAFAALLARPGPMAPASVSVARWERTAGISMKLWNSPRNRLRRRSLATAR